MEKFLILKTKQSTDYELLDSGEGKKLERYGNFVLSRPDPQALWLKRLPESTWQQADFEFVRKGKEVEWKIKHDAPKKWNIAFEDLNFSIRPTTFKHTGLFPEQAENWKWVREIISSRKSSDKKPVVLNLFGYTGGATLAAAKAGAEVVHVDGSKMAIEWARENAELSGLKEKPVRWILDDAKAFLKKEVRRGKKYDGIIMDPPAFGHGAKNEIWKIEEDFLELLDLCRRVLSEDPLFFLINGYASGYSPIAYANNLEYVMEGHSGTMEIGELAIEESRGHSTAAGEAKTGRLLPAGIFARWKKYDSILNN